MTLTLQLNCQDWDVSFQLLPFLNEITIGNAKAVIPIPGCPPELGVRCVQENQEYVFSALGNTILHTEGSHAPVCKPNEKIRLHVMDSQEKTLFTVTASVSEEIDVPHYDRYIDLEQDRPIHVGANSDADLIIRHPLIRSRAFTMQLSQNYLQITPQSNIPMGVYVNTKRIRETTTLFDGDFIYCAGFRAYWYKGQLLVPANDPITVQTLHYSDEKEQNSHLVYPCINRTSRKLQALSQENIEILDPPSAPSENKNNIFLSLLPAVAMIFITIFLRGSMGSGSSMILFSVASLSIGAISSVVTYLHTSKENKKKAAQREEKYQQYIREQEERIQMARNEECEILRSIYLSPEQEIRNVRDFSAQLFDRNVTDADFLDLRLGEGTLRATRKIDCKKHEVFEASDALFALPKKLTQKYTYLDRLPAKVSLSGANAIGIIGDDKKLSEMLKITVLDLATRQYFEDVILYNLLTSAFIRDMESYRFLPHFKNRALDRRNLAHDEESQKVLVEELYKELSDREGQGQAIAGMPWLVVYIHTGNDALMRHPLIKYVEKAASLKTVFIFLSRHRELLPQGCSYRIQLFNNRDSGVITAMRANEPDQLFDYVPLKRKQMQEVAQRLAPVYSGEINLASRLSTSESLYNMLGFQSTSQIDVLSRWRSADTSKSLAAPLGIADGGNVLNLDLHEKFHGPHGLVAGTTGSGKSQVLISYILSMASLYSPEDVTFCVIDFKGGDIVKHLRGLPHIVGSITNLEQHEITRSLKSINAEKNKRMQLFADPQINASNISDYTRAYKEGRAKIPLPHLIVIVDEFAELKSQHPDFMNDLISIARVGRSLGIHMILCTQKPAGVVDGQIWGNSDFKLCLRVQTKEDSNEVLKSPLASQIREPGRGYLQVDRTDEFVLFQSGYSGVSENSAQKDQKFSIHQLNLSGKKTLAYRYEPPKKKENSLSQCNALLQKIIEAYEASGIAEPAKLCLPSIPEEIPYEELPASSFYSIPVGQYDDPDNQRIMPLEIDLTDKNILVVGNSQMGKTNLLTTMLRRLAGMKVTDVNVYILDFNALLLKTMEALSIVGGVVTADDEEKLKNLLKLLRNEMMSRKSRLMDAGVTSFTAYRESHDDLPLIVVMIDNYAPFRELYEDKYGDEITTLMRDGTALGITFCVTVQQASLMSYRKLFYFGKRIVFPLNEKSEYMNVLDGCRMDLKETPGRVLIAQDKQFFEGQTFLAFEGETETQKAANIRAFVLEHNALPKAPIIPSVPTLLTTSFLQNNYGHALRPHQYPYGMDYASVSPTILDINEQFILSLLGSDEKGKERFIQHFMRYALSQQAEGRAKVFLLDDYRRSMKGYNQLAAFYSTEPADIQSLLEQTEETLQQRLHDARKTEDGTATGETIIFVINSIETVKYMSENSLLFGKFSSIAEKYRRMHVFFLLTCIPNKPINYSAPELLRFVREERKALLFEEANAIRAFDIPLALQRSNARPRMNNEAFYLSEDDLSRVKLIDMEDRE